MKKLITALAAVALLTPAAAGAKTKTPVYRIYGGYDLTSTIYTKCVPVGGGTNLEETTTVVRHFAYSGDTKRGITVKETRTEHLSRVSDSPYLPSTTIDGEPFDKTYTSKPLKVGKKGYFSYDGIGNAGRQDRISFSVPKKPGKATQIKLDSKTSADDPDPGVGCSISRDSTTVSGAVLVKRIG
jgi:hypothetical protein